MDGVQLPQMGNNVFEKSLGCIIGDILACFDFLRPSHHFFSYIGVGLPRLNHFLAKLICLHQGHNPVTLVRLKPQSSV